MYKLLKLLNIPGETTMPIMAGSFYFYRRAIAILPLLI